MDCLIYRNSGELSDITVLIDGEEFHLHKFPLFVRSNYFKNLSSLSSDQGVSRVVLDNFPGGPRVFEIIADYCYNKDVQVNINNVIAVRCAAEYLDMTGGTGRGGLAMLADNVLFDLTYSAKTKRDYQFALLLLQNAAKYQDIAERCNLQTKLIDSFVENLTVFVKSAAVYDSIGLYDKTASSFTPKKSLHNLSLNDENLNILNNLPLRWINDMIRSAARNGLHSSLLSYIIQNYIDFNTGLNPHYNAEANEPNTRNRTKSNVSNHGEPKTENLIAAVGEIMRVDSRLSGALNESDNSSNLVSIASNIMAKDKPSSLIDIASDILVKDNKPSNLISVAGEILDQDPKPSSLIGIASDINSKEKPLNLINIAGDVLSNDSPSNLIKIAGDILEGDDEKPVSNLVNIAGELNDKDQSLDDASTPLNLVNIAGDILQKDTSNLVNIASDILLDEPRTSSVISTPKPKATPRKNLSDEAKLNVISVLTNSLVELRVDAQFPISWLLLYMSALHNLNAEQSIKSAFHRWTWNAMHDLKSNSQELSSVPPSVMIQLAEDISSKDENNLDSNKLIDLTDRYIADLDHENKLNTDTFLKLASCIPKDKRTSFDKLARVLINLLRKENHNITSDRQKELLNLIDFQKLNEKTLDECKNSEYIPPQYITEAALALCAKLRKELDESKLLIKSLESTRSRPLISKFSDSGYTSSLFSSKYTPSSSRNRSNEPKISDHRSSSSYINPSTNKITYPLTTTSSSSSSSSASAANAISSHLYNNYSLLTPRTYHSTSRPTSTSVLNSTYKASFNPSSSLHGSHLHHHHYHNHHYLDYASDESYLDNGDSSTYLDDNDGHDYNYHSSYSYSKIY